MADKTAEDVASMEQGGKNAHTIVGETDMQKNTFDGIKEELDVMRNKPEEENVPMKKCEVLKSSPKRVGSIDSSNNEDSVCNVEAKNMSEEPDQYCNRLSKQIIRQIEYYFGDINLPKDEFMKNQMCLNNGWIPMDVIKRFKRLANLTKDSDVIIYALIESKSTLIEISEDHKKIRRNPNLAIPALTHARKEQLLSQTVYCKGFPRNATLEELLDFFEKYGKVLSLKMRKRDSKKTKTTYFIGSTYIIFSTEQEADDFLKLDNVKYGDTPLLRLRKIEYVAQKKAQLQQIAEKSGLEQKKQAKAESVPQGSVLQLKGVFGDDTGEKLKHILEETGHKITFLDYSKGDEAWVCFQEDNAAKMILEKLGGNKLMLKEFSVDICAVDKEQEEIFLKKAMSKQEKHEDVSSGCQQLCGEDQHEREADSNYRKKTGNDHGEQVAKKIKVDGDLSENEKQ